MGVTPSHRSLAYTKQCMGCLEKNRYFLLLGLQENLVQSESGDPRKFEENGFSKITTGPDLKNADSTWRVETQKAT